MGSCYLPIFYTGSGGSDKLEIKYKNTWEYNQTWNAGRYLKTRENDLILSCENVLYSKKNRVL